MSGLARACVVPNKGCSICAEGELRRFILDGMLQTDSEASFVALAETVTSELGGLALRKSSTEWKQAHGAVGNSQQLFYKNFIFYRIAERAVKHCRSSRSTTHGGMVKNPLALARQENKQANKQKTQTQQHKNTTTQTDQTAGARGR